MILLNKNSLTFSLSSFRISLIEDWPFGTTCLCEVQLFNLHSYTGEQRGEPKSCADIHKSQFLKCVFMRLLSVIYFMSESYGFEFVTK